MQDEDVQEISFRIIEAVRGSWIGLNRGLYQRNDYIHELEAKCLDLATMDNFNDAIQIFQNAEDAQGDIFTAIGKLTFVLANLNYCNFRKPVQDIVAFCSS